VAIALLLTVKHILKSLAKLAFLGIFWPTVNASNQISIALHITPMEYVLHARADSLLILLQESALKMYQIVLRTRTKSHARAVKVDSSS
jgi:hypothetical protein